MFVRGAQLVDVEDSRFSANNNEALSVTASRSSATAVFIRRSRFDNVALSMTAEQHADFSSSVDDCLFNSSRVEVDGYTSSRVSSIRVSNSSFQSSGVRVVTPLESHNLNLSIVRCSFRRLAYQPVVELVTPAMNSVTISDNVFEENSRDPCVKFTVPEVSGFVSPGLVSVVGNIFTNHSGASVIVLDFSAYNDFYHHVQLRRNAFQNPLCPFEIEVRSRWRDGYEVNASENWWGSTSRTYVAERISDVFSDSRKAKVSLTSMYTDPEMTQLEVIPDPRTWSVTNETIVGGELDRNVTLAGSDTPYFVNRTIYIPKGFQLLLGENVALHFEEVRGIIIEGI